MITTITPYWGRPSTLRTWLEAVRAATSPQIRHIIYFVGDPIPEWVVLQYKYWPTFKFIPMSEKGGEKSIAHYHHLGALAADTEWIMKMDVDAIPNTDFFNCLESVLLTSKNRTDWFNIGMYYLSPDQTADLRVPLEVGTYASITRTPMRFGGTNFVCRRSTYLSLGNCAEQFKGWGWEDYQQIYMLEKYRRENFDPLPGHVDIYNVTNRCRDEISLPSAKNMLARHSWMALLHVFHPMMQGDYRSHSQANRQLLLDYILKHRRNL